MRTRRTKPTGRRARLLPRGTAFRIVIGCALVVLIGAAAPAFAAPDSDDLESRLDEEAFLRGLVDYGLPEVLDVYIEERPSNDPLVRARRALARSRLTMRLATTDTERRAALQDVLARRTALLAAAPAHPSRAVWLADQATDLFFTRLAFGGLDLVVPFGRPSRAEQALYRETGVLIEALAGKAEPELERALRTLATTAASDPVAELQRRRLIRDERERRIPFLRGVGAVMRARSLTGAEQRDQNELGLALLGPAADALEGELADRAQWYAGLAAVALGRSEEAEERFRAVRDREDASSVDRLAASLGYAQAAASVVERRRRLAELAASPLADDLFTRLLLADMRFELDRPTARTSAERALAYRGWLELLDETRGVDPAQLRRIVSERVAEAAMTTGGTDGLPAFVRVAVGKRLAAAGDGAAALVEFQAARTDPGADADTQAEARYGVGRLHLDAGEDALALAVFKELAIEQPDHPRAAEALEIAATLAYRLAQGEATAGLRVAARALIARLRDRGPDGVDLDPWHYRAGRLALEEGDGDAAYSAFAAVREKSAVGPDAAFLMLEARRRMAEEQGGGEALRRFLDDAEPLAARLDRAIEAADEARLGTLRGYRAQTAGAVAHAWITLGEPERALEELDVVPARGVPDTSRAVMLRARINALEALGRSDAIADAIDDLERTTPGAVGSILDAIVRGQLAAFEKRLDAGESAAEVSSAAIRSVPLAERLATLAGQESDRVRRDAMRRRAADLYRLAGAYGRALALYDDLLQRAPNAGPLVFGRAEALFGRGDADADAILIYKRIVAAGPGRGHHPYWQSQLRILEILDRAGRNTERIVPRINQLRLMDESLGGPRYERGFQRLMQAHVG